MTGPNLFNQLIERETETNSIKFQSNLYRERLRIARNLYKSDLIAHYGCVNAIEFSNGGDFLISGGDDKRILFWNIEKAIAEYEKPRCMEKEHQSNIFCLSFSTDNSKILSGGNDDLLIVHDNETGKVFDVYIHTKPVYGLCVDPTCDSIVATAGEDGRIIIFDQRKGTAVMSLGKYRAPFHAVQFHPMDGKFLVSANSKKGAAFWDIREPHNPMIHYGGEGNQQSCMSVRFNSNGTQVLALRRRLPPILYKTFSENSICQFYHPDYYNSCTMKSCCFAGEDDEFVLSGSDDFNLYVWRVGDVDLDLTDQLIEQTQMVLYGHRSIVNQVRYNSQKCLLASSGVEKVVKLWSPFQQRGWLGGLTEEASGPDNPREVFSHNDYFSLVQMNWSNMTHDYSNQNTHEDPRMMAFFDSLIQQEIEGWDTNNTTDSEHISEGSSENSTRQSSTEDSEDDNLDYFTHTRDRHRRGGNNSIKPQRQKYANRIAYLIATKRNTLRRLALKGASQSNRRRQNSLKTIKRKNHNQNNRNPTRTSRNGTGGKRVGRYNSMSRRATTRIREDSEAQKIARYKGLNTLLFRSHRRRTQFFRRDSSSDEDVTNSIENENIQGSSSQNMAIPSTSTGITSNGKERLRYLQQQLNDSDEDNSASNSDEENAGGGGGGGSGNNNIATGHTTQRIQINGVNNSSAENNHNNLSSDVDGDRYSSPTNRRKRHHAPPPAPLPPVELDIYSSHSNSRLSNSSYLEDEHDSSSNESLDCFSKKRKAVPTNNNNNSNNNNNNGSSIECCNASSASVGIIIEVGTSNNNNNNNLNENCNHDMTNYNNSTTSLNEIKTPTQNGNLLKRNTSCTPDSGISSAATPGCSSTSSSNHNSNNCLNGTDHNSCSDEKFAIKLFQQKIARVRRNYRKKFGIKSDSD